MMFSEKLVSKMGELAEELLKSETVRMQKAYAKQDDGKLTVALSFIVQPSQAKGMMDIDCTIQYTMEKIKEKITCRVAENQTDFIEKLRPKAGSGIDSVTLTAGGKSVTLEQKK